MGDRCAAEYTANPIEENLKQISQARHKKNLKKKIQARHKAAGAAGVIASYLANTMAMALSKSQDLMLEKLSGQHQVCIIIE